MLFQPGKKFFFIAEYPRGYFSLTFTGRIPVGTKSPKVAATEAFIERKALARKAGEEAGTKLLLPMGLMLCVVMVVIIVPAFMSF